MANFIIIIQLTKLGSMGVQSVSSNNTMRRIVCIRIHCHSGYSLNGREDLRVQDERTQVTIESALQNFVC